MDAEGYAAGRNFIEREGRLLEQRLATTVFDGDDRSGVVAAVAAYRNADGGFGHGLEPDKRCPASLPIDVELAIEALLVAGNRGDQPEVARFVIEACDWLASVSTSEGAVPLAFPIIESYPRADHWTDWTYEPALNPTAGLVGRLRSLGVDHPWVDSAEEWVWARLDADPGEDVHTIVEVMRFLAAVPDRGRAERIAVRIDRWLAVARWYRADPADPTYGLTPLHIASSPDSPWRMLFDDDIIAGHLARLERDQQADGGWPITWEPPGDASVLEWRGIETLRALRTLRAYGSG